MGTKEKRSIEHERAIARCMSRARTEPDFFRLMAFLVEVMERDGDQAGRDLVGQMMLESKTERLRKSD